MIGTTVAKQWGVQTMTIFDSIGGASSVNAAVDQFYLRVLDDPELKHYFAGVDMAS
jgi:hemoglobin